MAAARQDWRAELGAIDPARLVFIDASAALTDMVRLYARSPRGARAHGAVLGAGWRRPTVIGAFGLEGMVGALSVEDETRRVSSSGAVFHAFLDRVLLPS